MAILRMNYFKGEFLHAEDFQLEQAYHLNMRRDHNKYFHTEGIIDGLQVVAGIKKVTIQAGRAIDKYGNEIIVESDEEVQISGTGDIGIKYKEEDDPDSYVDVGFTGWKNKKEFYEIILGTDTDAIILAQVDSVPDDANVVLKDYTPAYAGPVAKGNVDIEGSLTVQGDLTVQGQTTVVETQHMQGNVVLGNEDSDTVTIEGILQTGHSSGRLMISSPVTLPANGLMVGTNQLVVNSNKVGIGIPNPAFPLETGTTINSWTARIKNDYDGTPRAYVYMGHGDGRGMHIRGYTTDTKYTLELFNASTRTNIFNNNGNVGLGLVGNVGIGTMAPQVKLHIHDDTVGDSNTGFLRLTGQGANARLYMGLNTNYAWIQSHGSKPLYINELGNNVILNKSAGNVGIGTESPGAKLEVAGKLRIGSNLENTAGKQLIQGGNVTDWLRIYGSEFTNGIAAYKGVSTDGGFYAGAWSQAGAGNVRGTGILSMSGSGNNYFAGKVGIGLTTPVLPLEVFATNSSWAVRIRNNYNGAARSYVHMGHGGGNGMHIQGYTTGNEYTLALLNATHTTNIFYNNGVAGLGLRGHVGIGKTNPGCKLDILANTSTWGGWYEAIRFSQNAHSAITHPGGGLLFGLHSNRVFYWADTTDAEYTMTLNHEGRLWIRDTLSQGSDIHLKKNITPLKSTIDKLTALRGVRFEWKDRKQNNIPHLGLIAQEVEPLFPELVTTGPDGMKAINYTGLIAPVIEGIKEQQKQLTEITARSEQQQNIINKIIKAQGANDFAEYFESVNEKKIKPGTSVVLEDTKVRPAKKDEIPFGVISENPGILGGMYLEWPKKYLYDDFGKQIMEEYKEEIMIPKKEKVTRKRQKMKKKKVKEEITHMEVEFKGGKYIQKEVTETVTREEEQLQFEEVDLYDEKGNNIGKHQIPVMETYEEEIDVLDKNGQPVLIGSGKFETGKRPKLNPEYDEKQEYIPRNMRPEWNCVGLLGQIPLRKGQPVAPAWIKIKDISEEVELWLVK